MSAQKPVVTLIASVQCMFCGEPALAGEASCLRHLAMQAETSRTNRPNEQFLFMGVLPHRQRHYWPDGKGRRHDG